jgi:hypothetical protein
MYNSKLSKERKRGRMEERIPNTSKQIPKKFPTLVCLYY